MCFSFQLVYQGVQHMHKVTKLMESTLYEFRIFACNEAGEGPVSAIYTYITTKAPPAAPKGQLLTTYLIWNGHYHTPFSARAERIVSATTKCIFRANFAQISR